MFLQFDSSPRKKLLKSKNENTEKEKLLAMVAHDLRAPLNAINYVLDKTIE